ncbi:MAG: hypothetical protein M3443_10655, partial [Actinomycetota bacterium]|nr:hypothetical protein [Actinomycetota bacterium]
VQGRRPDPMTSLDPAEFGRLFADVRRSALRVETLPEYHEPHEADEIRRWRAGLPPDDTWASDYAALVRRHTAAGRTWRRIRVVDAPRTEYQRWVADLAARVNIPAGERVRLLPRDHPLVPSLRDVWIFDDTATLMSFHHGAFDAAWKIADPAEVAALQALAEQAWEAATPTEQTASSRL